MKLITHYGHRVDHPLDRAILKARLTPFAQLSQKDRQRLKTLLSIQHQERERRRFAPIN